MHRLITKNKMGQFYWRAFTPKEMSGTPLLPISETRKDTVQKEMWTWPQWTRVKAGIPPCLGGEQAPRLSLE